MKAAYSQAFNEAVHAMAKRLMPQGFDVSDHAPQTYDELMAHHAATGRIKIWAGASDRTIFGEGPDGLVTNHAFRAWHDWTHVFFGLDFTKEGEYEVALRQSDAIDAQYRPIIADYLNLIVQAEVVGQFRYKVQWGAFPLDQYGFVVAYMTDQDQALLRAKDTMNLPRFGKSKEASK